MGIKFPVLGCTGVRAQIIELSVDEGFAFINSTSFAESKLKFIKMILFVFLEEGEYKSLEKFDEGGCHNYGTELLN